MMPNGQLGALVATVYELQSAWLEPRLAKLGVRWTTFQLLATVYGCGDEASQAEVARRLGVAPATLSESVQSHIKQGLLDRKPSTTDKRLKILVLTNQGKRLMGQIRTLVAECEDLMTKNLKDKDAIKCEQILDEMVTSLEKALES